MNGETASTYMRLMQAMPDSLSNLVRAPLDRIGRELSYLHDLLAIEQRQTEWDRVLEIAAPLLASWEGGALSDAAQMVPDIELALAPWQELAKSLTISYVGHAHMDMNWLWDWPETVEVVVNTLTTVDRLMDEFPEFRFSQSQTAVYDTVRRFAPQLFDRIGERVRQGRWEITANQWVEGDKNLASDESIVRHLLYSKQFFAEHWGIAADAVAIDFEPDTFGHPRGLPTLYQEAGVRWLYFCRGGPGDTAFRWQAPDGSEVVAWSDFQEWYNGTITGDEVQGLLQFYAESKVPHFLKVYGVGDHGGGPTRKDLNRLMEMRTWPIFPTLNPARLSDHFTALERHRQALPTFCGELNYVFAGCYSSESDIKTLNAQNEADLRSAEGLQVMAGLLGVSLARSDTSLQEAWEGTLFSQFHDILSGSGIPETYRYALGKGQDVTAAARIAAQQAMAAISGAIDTTAWEKSGETILVVFNPLAWERSDVVEMDVYERFEPGTALCLRDAEGHSVPVQYHYDSHLGFPGHRRVRLKFFTTVPGLGYAILVVGHGPQELAASTPEATVENIAVGHQTLQLSGRQVADLGLVSTPEHWHHEHLPSGLRLFRQLGVSLYAQGYQVATPSHQVRAHAGLSGVSLTGPGGSSTELGTMQWVREGPNDMSAWEIGPELERRTLVGTRWTVAEVGPVAIRLCGQTAVGPSKVVTWVTVYPNSRRMDWEIDTDWREFGSPETGIPGLSVTFGLPPLTNRQARFGQSVGSIGRPIPSRDVPAQGWTAVIGDEGAAVVYHPTRYGVSVSDEAIQVTLLRASYHPDGYAEIGHHRIPISFEWSAEVNPDRWTRTAMSRLSPLIGWVGALQTGSLPSRAGTLALTSATGVVTAVKPAESGGGAIVRMRHDEDRTASLELSVGDQVTGASRTSILEAESVQSLEWAPGRVAVPTSAHGIATVRLHSNKL